jgi:hypothetical protein
VLLHAWVNSRRAILLWGLIVITLSALGVLSLIYLRYDEPEDKIRESEIYKAAVHMDVLLECPGRLWPVFNWDKRRVTFEDEKQPDAVVWNFPSRLIGEQHARIRVVPAGSVRALKAPAFKFVSEGILVSRPPHMSWQQLVDTTIHETFHQTQQKEIKTIATNKSTRNVTYPQDWEPRYFRQEIIDSLREELATELFRNVRGVGLAHGAFWKKRLKELYPDDIGETHGLDVMEGTADFVGEMGVALATLGCDASDDELIANASTRRPFVNLGKADESYRLGLYAGLLLEKRKVNGWRERAAKGEAPLDILLAGTPPQKDEGDAVLKERVKDFYERENATIREVIAGYKGEFVSTQYFPLAIPVSWEVGSYQTRDPFIQFDLSDGLKNVTMIQAMVCQIRKPGGAGSAELKGQNVVVASITVPGGKSAEYYLFPVPAEALKNDASGYSIETEHVTVSQLQLLSVEMPGVGSVRVAH